MGNSMVGGFFVGASMVGGDQDVTNVDAGGGVTHGESRVRGSLALGYSFGGEADGSSLVVVAISRIDNSLPAGHVTGSTTVTGAQPTISILRARSTGRTSLTAVTSGVDRLTVHVATRSTVAGKMSGAWQLVGRTSSGTTSPHGNLTRLALLSGGRVTGSTSVTAAQPIIYLLPGARIALRTTATAYLSYNGAFGAHSIGKTAVAAAARLTMPLLATTISGATTARGTGHSYPTDFYDVHIALRTTVTSTTLVMTERFAVAVHGKTKVAGQLYGTWKLVGGPSGKTRVTGNVTFPRWFSTGQLIAGQTSVTADAFRSTLHGGHALGGTAVTGYENVASRPSGAIHGRTVPTARFFFRYFLSGGTSHGKTALKSRLHSYPTDFQDVFLRTRTSVSAQGINLSTSFTKALLSPITARTTVVADPAIALQLRCQNITGSTKVAAKARSGFGGDAKGLTNLKARVGLLFGKISFSGSRIATRTTVTGIAPRNGFVGTATCWTAFAPRPFLGIAFPTVVSTIAGLTAFHTHFGGRVNPHDGPIGSVALTAVPRGDMGVPDEIDGSSGISADVSVERSRILAFTGNTGLAVDRSLVASGSAAGGNGTRIVGVPWDMPETVMSHPSLYN